MFSIINSMKAQKAQLEEERDAKRYRELIRKEAEIGGALFGPVKRGGRREFFCLDDKTWIWHEEWTDDQGQPRVVTTRYDIRPNGILKAQDGQPYRYIDREEARRLYKAARMYNHLVNTKLYAN